MSILQEDTITFGKFKGLTIKELLKDRNYCKWFLQQEELAKKYEYIFNRIKQYKPRKFFIPKEDYDIEKNIGNNITEFLENYPYFHLYPIEEVKIELNDTDKKCYSFYLEMMVILKTKIIMTQSYNIKAPSSWLKLFETKYGMTRDIFKEFINSYDLPNIPYIVEDIKKMGGIEYKGAKSFLIAKQKSLEQEKYWENILKEKYGQDIGTQYKFNKCFFDFIHINTTTIYECKLGLKDFDEDQHNKYLIALEKFSIIYLIDRDCIVNIKNNIIYTTNVEKYRQYLLYIPIMKESSKFDKLIQNFKVEEIKNVKDVI